MFKKLMSFLGLSKKIIDDGECKVHPTLGTTKDRLDILYYCVGEYTYPGYVRVAETLASLPFLTIIDKNPLVFQICDSNVILSPNRDGGIVFFETVITSAKESLAHPKGYLIYNIISQITADEVLEMLNDDDKVNFIYSLDIFTRKQ